MTTTTWPHFNTVRSILNDCPCSEWPSRNSPKDCNSLKSSPYYTLVGSSAQDESIPLLDCKANALSMAYSSNVSDYLLGPKIGIGCNEATAIHRGIFQNLSNNVSIRLSQLEADKSREFTEVVYEAQLTRQLRHPNLLPYFVTFTCNYDVWAITPRMEYGSALDLIQGPLPEGIPELLIAFILHDVLLALEYLHRRCWLIHRSVRASHILISRDGRVCLSGMRHAVSLVHGGRFQQNVHQFSASFANNLNWSSPELLAQDLSGYGTKSDVYSIGITACEMANGVVPFANMEPSKMLVEKLHGAMPVLLDASTCPLVEGPDPPPPDTEGSLPEFFKRRTFSESFHQFTKLCLHREPSYRPTVPQLLQHQFFKQRKRSASTFSELLETLAPLPLDDGTWLQECAIIDNTTGKLEDMSLDDWCFE